MTTLKHLCILFVLLYTVYTVRTERTDADADTAGFDRFFSFTGWSDCNAIKRKYQSLSALVENYFRALTRTEQDEKSPYSPTVIKLTGSVLFKEGEKPEEIRDRYLIEKYIRE